MSKGSEALAAHQREQQISEQTDEGRAAEQEIEAHEFILGRAPGGYSRLQANENA